MSGYDKIRLFSRLQSQKAYKGHTVFRMFLTKIAYIQYMSKESLTDLYKAVMPGNMDYNGFLCILGVYKDSMHAYKFITNRIHKASPVVAKNFEDFFNGLSHEYGYAYGKSLNLMLNRFNEHVFEDYVHLPALLEKHTGVEIPKDDKDLLIASKFISLLQNNGEVSQTSHYPYLDNTSVYVLDGLMEDVKAGKLSEKDFKTYFD